MKFVQCNCLTKTPEPRHHKNNCPVWLVDRVKTIEKEIERYIPLMDAVKKLDEKAIHSQLSKVTMNVINQYRKIK